MSSLPSLDAEKQRRLQDVLAEYLDAFDAGRPINRDELLARHPDLAVELNEFFINHDEMAHLADPAVTRDMPDSGVPAAAAPPPARGIGDYEFQHEIARGGMGVVYRARQISLNRVVALKMLLPGQAASSRTLRRFRVEAEAAAQLDHPNIVPIFEVGEIDGQPYFTMKLIEGGSVAGRLDELRLPSNPRSAAQKGAQLAELLATVARAVHHAHQHGILHRDLKPANILLDADNRPMVADFGLAKRFEQDVGLTQPQTVIGTASYMPPEQANARNDDLTTAADVYSLGAILYELLTGKPPFVGATYFDTLRQVVEEPPVPPRSLNPAVSADLEAICLKCLEKQREQRYPSAQTLAEDLDRWRNGEAISLRRLTIKERTWRWARRNRLAATLLATVALLMIVVTIGSLVAVWQIADARDKADEKARLESESRAKADEERAKADSARAATEAEKRETHRLLMANFVANGTRALEDGDVFTSLVWYGEALRRDPAHEDANRVRLSGALRRCPRLVQVWFGNETATPALSPDGRRVLLTQKEVTRAWDVASGQAVLASMKHSAVVKQVAFSPDGKRIVTVGADGTARIWDASNGQPITPFLRHDKLITWAAFSPAGDRLATVGDKNARIWDIPTGKLLIGPLAHDVPLLFASFSRDGDQLVTCGGEGEPPKGEVRVWDLGAAKPTSQTLARRLIVHWAHLTADGKHVVAVAGPRMGFYWSLSAGGSSSQGVSAVRVDPHGAVGLDSTRVVKLNGATAQIFDMARGQSIGEPLVHGGEIYLTAFSPDGRLVVTAASDRTARVWDAATGKPVTPPLTTPLSRIKRALRADFSSDGHRLLLTEDGQVCVWDLEPHDLGQAVKALPASGASALSPDGRLIATVDTAGAIWVRDAVTDRQLHGPWKMTRSVVAVTFSPDSRRLFAASDTEARIWDAATGEAVMPVWSHSGVVHRLLFTPDGSRAVIYGSKDKKDSIEVYDIGSTAAQPALILKEKVPHFGMVLTPNARQMVPLPRPGQVQNIELCDVATGERWKEPFRHPSRVTAATISPNGALLATATADGTAFLWDIDTGRAAAPTLHHGQPLHQIAFSGDGRRLVTLAEDHSARVWDVATGQPMTPLLRHSQAMAQAMLSFDGSRLAMQPRSGAGWVWGLSPDMRPIDDLLYLTQALSGQVLDSQTGGLASAPGGNLRTAWPDLRKRFPREFGP